MIRKEADVEIETINERLYADNQCMAHEKHQDVQQDTTRQNATWEKYNMKISRSKTECIQICRTPGNHDININNKNTKK